MYAIGMCKSYVHMAYNICQAGIHSECQTSLSKTIGIRFLSMGYLTGYGFMVCWMSVEKLCNTRPV